MLRFYICNISKIIESKDQIELIKTLTCLIKKLAQKEKINNAYLSLVNSVFGIERLVKGSHFEKTQILKASMQRFGDNNTEQYQMEN